MARYWAFELPKASDRYRLVFKRLVSFINATRDHAGTNGGNGTNGGHGGNGGRGGDGADAGNILLRFSEIDMDLAILVRTINILGGQAGEGGR